MITQFLTNPLVAKALLILIVGMFEQFIYSGHLLLLTKKKAEASSLVLFLHLNIYLLLIGNIINDMDKIIWFIPFYAFGCAVGNYIRIKVRIYKDTLEKELLKKAKRTHGKKKIYKKKLY